MALLAMAAAGSVGGDGHGGGAGVAAAADEEEEGQPMDVDEPGSLPGRQQQLLLTTSRWAQHRPVRERHVIPQAHSAGLGVLRSRGRWHHKEAAAAAVPVVCFQTGLDDDNPYVPLEVRSKRGRVGAVEGWKLRLLGAASVDARCVPSPARQPGRAVQPASPGLRAGAGPWLADRGARGAAAEPAGHLPAVRHQARRTVGPLLPARPRACRQA